MANKRRSESDNSSSRSRTRAAAKPAAPRQPATTASSSRAKSSDEVNAQIDTAADLSRATDADLGNPGYNEIAEAAYHRYLGRGAQDGRDFDDWVEAERELRSRRTS